MKSGAGQPDKTVRDEKIMATWSFLVQHIVRGTTYPSDEVSIYIYTFPLNFICKNLIVPTSTYLWNNKRFISSSRWILAVIEFEPSAR